MHQAPTKKDKLLLLLQLVNKIDTRLFSLSHSLYGYTYRETGLVYVQNLYIVYVEWIKLAILCHSVRLFYKGYDSKS